MKATLTNYRQSPRKVRLVANLIKGKTVKDADVELSFLVKRSAEPLQKLLRSAVANAQSSGTTNAENLIVKNVTVDKGVVLKRFMPRAFGRASRINKRSSHVTLTLGEAVVKESKAKPKSKAAKKVTKTKK